MEALSRREENEINEAAKKEALRSCDDFVKGKVYYVHNCVWGNEYLTKSLDFADCATGRTFSLPFMCRTRLNAMQGCMRD